MPDVALDLSLIQNGLANDANAVRAALTALQTAVNDLDAENLTAAVATLLGLTTAGGVRRGKSIIATTESLSSAAYGLMATPDRVQSVALPTDGLIAVTYQAAWQESVASAARAAVFIGANQVVAAPGGASTAGVRPLDGGAALTNGINLDGPLGTPVSAFGSSAVAPAGAYTGDVTTGQIVGTGVGSSAGPAFFFAAAGTYDVSVQFKASSGSVTVKNRRLRVWTLGF